MFTGHIREIGVIDSLSDSHVQIRVPAGTPLISAGGSVCVNGVRLTVQDLGGDVFGATLTAETRRRSTFGTLVPGDQVNVELPMTAGTTLDGHLVQGYVDARGPGGPG